MRYQAFSLVAFVAGLVAAQSGADLFAEVRTAYTPIEASRSLFRRQSCRSGYQTCGTGCIPTGYECCGDHKSVCESAVERCWATTSGYGCCPLGKTCNRNPVGTLTTNFGGQVSSTRMSDDTSTRLNDDTPTTRTTARATTTTPRSSATFTIPTFDTASFMRSLTSDLPAIPSGTSLAAIMSSITANPLATATSGGGSSGGSLPGLGGGASGGDRSAVNKKVLLAAGGMAAAAGLLA